MGCGGSGGIWAGLGVGAGRLSGRVFCPGVGGVRGLKIVQSVLGDRSTAPGLGLHWAWVSPIYVVCLLGSTKLDQVRHFFCSV